MGIDCKVCKSEKRDYIEQLILQGHSNLAVSTTLKDMNEDISHASINRHKTKHMIDHAETIRENAGEKGNRKYDREDSKNDFAINASVIYKEIKLQALHVMSYDDLAESNMMVRLMLNRVLNNQMAITIDLQEKYMNGDSKYPNEQIRGLQIIQDMAQKFEEFARKNFNHYRTLMHSDSGIKQHIVEMGKKAKQELNLILPYEKGNIFIKSFEEYKKEYNPTNPYTESTFTKESNYEYYKQGIESGRTTIEILDVKLISLIISLSDEYEIINYDEYEKIINRYKLGKYDVSKEIRKYEKMIDKIEDEDEDEDEDEA